MAANRRVGRYIAVEGPIGVGKTALARRLATEFGSQLVLERVEDNPFLSKFYEDPDFGYRHLTRAPVRYLLMKGISLGWTYKQMQFWSPLMPFAKPDNYLIRNPDFGRAREPARRPRAASGATADR